MERTTYSYNANNQLINLITGEETQDYSYDMRGNLTGVTRGEELIKSFTFDATNRMTMSSGIKDGIRKRADYRYNGLGQRVGQRVYENDNINPEKEIHYTLDLTRQYHNLLNLKDNITDKEQTYYWDMNVAVMEENEAYNYYLQDDLGSPMQLLDEEGLVMETYGFDEFGMELPTDNILAFDTNRANNPNTAGLHNNKPQPFSFTGYQMDEAGEMYFAQARRYDAGAGRFVSEDKIVGWTNMSFTLNRYSYCWNSPLGLLDMNGLEPTSSNGGLRPTPAEEGDEAHLILQMILYVCFDAEIEYPIPYSSSHGNTGYADIVIDFLGRVEIYEIKPGSYSAKGTPRNKQGRAQLQRYVQNYPNGNAVEGTTLFPIINCFVVPSIYYPDKLIKYYTYSDQPGMIYWNYVNKPRIEQEKETSAATIVKEANDKKEEIIIAIAVLYGTYEVAKWGVALMLAFPTGGASIGAAACTP